MKVISTREELIGRNKYTNTTFKIESNRNEYWLDENWNKHEAEPLNTKYKPDAVLYTYPKEYIIKESIERK